MSPSPANQLSARWDALVRPLGAPAERADAVFADLAARHGGPDRHYHNLDHLAAVLDALEPASGARSPLALRLAAWFHDAVYDSRAADNEERSAALARAALADLNGPESLGDEVARLVLLTRGHATGPEDRDGQVLLDADLAILGAPADEYDRYAAAIRREYAWVAEEAYRAGRGRVLQDFLRRPRIFQTEVRAAREEQARANLARELARLSSS
jgi:predicted metal-dependent HD superfamily phosphohydrolase